MAITRLQHATNGGDNSVTTVSMSPLTTGSLVVVLAAWNTSSITLTLSDGTNTYTQVPGAYIGPIGGQNRNLAIYACPNVVGGPTTITGTFSSTGAQVSLCAFEYSGASSTVDAAGNHVAAGGTIVSPTLTLTNLGDVMLTMIFSLSGAIASVSPGTAAIVDNFFTTWATVEDFPNTTGSYHETSDFVGQDFATVSAAFTPSTATVRRASMELMF